ncbi:helix-turn-helix domain-containing protein [Lentilactobacillus kribbianus]|uniref:helix-turn-helix domain-containing protein n=1 Tax=Lentilactobacillus kribbianus TaxID=2729622 RepID=UPI0015543020|nr:helix-turn-helix transcriptional regulator [Lentilactobacillus kribbianus]
MTLGTRLMKQRQQDKLSREEVANALTVTTPLIVAWESDTELPDYNQLIQLSRLFEVTTDYLLTGQPVVVKTTNRQHISYFIQNFWWLFFCHRWLVSVVYFNVNQCLKSIKSRNYFCSSFFST